MSANASDQPAAEQPVSVPAPKPITNAQTVCNEKNAKNKPCWGHLKQLRTAGEPAEVHLRGDDVLFKCQTCGTLYMGPPLGHVRDPYKQRRFVEAELSALLQAAGGTLPVIKKNERGVYVLVEDAHGAAEAKPAAAKPATAAKPAAAPASSATAAPPAAPAAPKPAAHKAGAEPNRQLFRRSTYAGVTDTGPVPGETFEQKVARLKAVSAAAKKRAEEGGEEAPRAATAEAPAAATPPSAAAAPMPSPAPAAPSATSGATSTEAAPAPAPAAPSSPGPAGGHKPTGQADRTLMRRSTYAGVTDTGPVPGETFEQKVERLRAVAAAAKQRAEGG